MQMIGVIIINNYQPVQHSVCLYCPGVSPDGCLGFFSPGTSYTLTPLESALLVTQLSVCSASRHCRHGAEASGSLPWASVTSRNFLSEASPCCWPSALRVGALCSLNYWHPVEGLAQSGHLKAF